MFHFSNKSTRKLQTCHDDLFRIAITALPYSNIDFGIGEGERSIDRQRKLYEQEKSTLNPDNPDQLKHAMHIPLESEGRHEAWAFDIVAYVNGKVTWEERPYIYLAGVLQSTANRLYHGDLISHKLRWGGDWDSDGEIITDQNFNDLVHFELKK